MSLTQRVTDLATRIGQEVKLKPSKSVNEVITGKWDMAQQGIKIGASLTAPNSGYIGFAAKADGLYQKIGAASDLRLLTETDASTYAPIGVISATLPAAAGWYRIATSAVGMNLCSGDFEIKWSISGAHGIANIYASIMYGQNPSLNMLNYSHYNSTGFTKTRIVYHTTYGGNYAYLEVYNASAIALQVSVKMMKNTGWTLLSPDTAGSIPSGYSTTEITFVDGIATEGQLASFVTTGIAPLSVTSTTAVTNLNADLLDGNHASAFALAGHNHTGTYQPLHSNLTAIAGLPVMPGLVRTDGAGNWSLDPTPYVVGSPWQGEGYIKDSDFASTGLMTRTGAGTYTITPTNTYSLAGHTHAGVYQPVDADLTAIAGVGGDVGFLRKTNVNTWTLDTSTYALSTHTHAGAYEPVLGNPATNGYILSSTTAGVRSWGALPLASSTVRGGILITGSTPAGGTLSIGLYNDAPYASLTASAIEYVLTSASITSHKHDTLYAKLAGSTTQAFSTANLSVTGTIVATSTVKGTFGIFTGLADNRVPYHVNDTTGLWDSAISADGTNMSINGGKINLSTLVDPTHYLYNNLQDWESIHTNTGFMVENYNGGVNPNYTGGVSTWASFSVTAAGAVWTNGNISALEVYRRSSRELKYEIQHFTGSAMSIINNTKIMSYRMKSDYSFSIGFIAEDTHPFLSGEDRKGHIFGNHLAILTKAIQEEDQKILQLQRQVTELQNQIKQLQDGRRL